MGRLLRAISATATGAVGFVLFAVEKGWHALDIIGRSEVALKLNHLAENLHQFLIAHQSIGFQILPWALMIASVCFLALLQWPELSSWRKKTTSSQSGDKAAKTQERVFYG